MPGSTDRAGDSIPHGPMELRPVLMQLVLSVIGSVLLMSGLSAVAITATGSAAWWSGWWAASIVSLIAAIISLAPLALGICLGIQTAIAGFFAGMMLRMLLTLGGCMAAVWFWHTSVKSTLLLAAPFYLVQLVAECVTLARAFWPAQPKSSFKHSDGRAIDGAATAVRSMTAS